MKEFIGVYCSHCRSYFRIYKIPEKMRYEGGCFKCGRKAYATIDPRRGSKRRFFVGR